MERLVIVGGGIAGLAAAYFARKSAGSNTQILVLEQSGNWGGKITTDRVDGFVIEGGPDTFVVTKPSAINLCRELGIEDRLRGTNTQFKRTYILKRGRLHELPGGLTMMIPTEFGPMIRTGLLSWSQKARMGMDFLLPPAEKNGDETLENFVTRRLGRAAYENLIEPLMSGIYAGNGDNLSLESTFPYLRDLELKHGGLVKGALAVRRARSRNGKKSAPGSRSIFLTPVSGLAEIVEALVENLEYSGVDLRLNTSVEKLAPAQQGYKVYIKDGKEIQVDRVILATPAFVSARMVEGFARELADELSKIEYVSTATVTLAYREEDLPQPLDGYGYVIPRSENRQALACTWTSTKFPHRAPEGHALIRVFIGRAGQEGQLPWDDQGLLEIARQELECTLSIRAEPELVRIFRWKYAMPQYNIGHPERIARINTLLAGHPRLALAGNGYQGIGIPDCIRSGELAVERLNDVSIPTEFPAHANI